MEQYNYLSVGLPICSPGWGNEGEQTSSSSRVQLGIV